MGRNLKSQFRTDAAVLRPNLQVTAKIHLRQLRHNIHPLPLKLAPIFSGRKPAAVVTHNQLHVTILPPALDLST
jgi:hypothetical protein